MISGWRSIDCRATAPSGVGASARVATTQSLGLGALPGGAPGTVQPSSSLPSSSNDVDPSPVETTTSSTTTPLNWYRSSLA